MTSLTYMRLIYQKTPRGMNILQSIKEVGLIDLEDRNNTDRHLPPDSFLRQAKSEISILGYTCHRTFECFSEIIQEKLDIGCKINILVCEPNSTASAEINKIEHKELEEELRNLYNLIRRREFLQHRGFNLRFYQDLLPYVGVMIDGDLEPTGMIPQDELAEIRVQPRLKYGTIEKGVVLHFRKERNRSSVFDYFAEDFRKGWKKASKEGLDYLEESK